MLRSANKKYIFSLQTHPLNAEKFVASRTRAPRHFPKKLKNLTFHTAHI
jgi:hypothetical protein